MQLLCVSDVRCDRRCNLVDPFLTCISFFSLTQRAAWSTITFFGDSVKGVFDKATNETYYVEVPRLPMKSYYPWNAMSGVAYVGTFAFQVNFA